MFSCLTPHPTSWGWNVPESERLLCSFCPHRVKKHKIQNSASTELHAWSKNMVNIGNSKFLKGNCKFFFSYLREAKRVSMFNDFSLFYYFLQLVSIIFCSGDVQIKIWQVFHQTFCFHFQIQIIWTTMPLMKKLTDV